MSPSDADRPQCPCCKECKDCKTGFEKVVNLKDAGLVIYRHTTRTEDVNKDTGRIECATKTTEDVFILHNTKAIEITSADYLPEIEQNKINCPRCRKIIEHAQKLLQKVPKINRNDVKGICEHCRNKDAPCFECKEVVKKFVASKTERTENTKERVKHWLSKIKHLLKDAVIDTGTGKERVRAHSELYIDQLCRESPTPGREPYVKQMFHPESDRSDFIRVFPPSLEKKQKAFGHFEKLEKLERPVVFIDSSGKVGKHSTSRPKRGIESIDVPDRDKVCFSDVDSEDLRAMFFSPLSEEERQREKHVELVDRKHLIPPVPFQSKEDFVLGSDEDLIKFSQILTPITLKRRHKSDEELGAITKSSIKTAKYTRRGDVSKRYKTIDGESDVEPDDYTELADQRAELATKNSLGSSKPAKGVLRKTGEMPNIIRKYHSEEALLANIGSVTGDVLKKDFSYIFPKILSPDKKQLKHKSSSELIKDTQDMLFTKAEEDKKKLDEERKKKFEEEEKKRIAREARKKQLEDKKLSEALEKKEHQKETKSYTDKKDEKEMIIPTDSTATSKSKSKDSRPATEKKELKAPKEPKEKDLKTPKENSFKTPKEPKEKELKVPKEPKKTEFKAPKEPKEKELKAPKEPKQSKEDAEKMKKEKEERLRKEKEEKEELQKKEKEEREKLKKEKEEQLRREKEMKQKEKDNKHREKDELQQEKGKGDTKQKEKPAPQNDGKREKDEAEKRAREEAKLQLKKYKETEIDTKPEPEKPKVAKKIEMTGTKDLNIKSIKVHKSSDDLILQLVKIKQSTAGERQRPKRLEDLKLTSKDVKNHRLYHKKNKMGDCFMCLDSNIELGAESLDLIHDDDRMADIIIGTKIFKYKLPLINRQEELNKPLFFQSQFDDTNALVEVATSPNNEVLSSPLTSGKPQGKHAEQEVPKGVIRYALSDRAFIDKGWTMLPTEKVVRKMNVYRMRPAHPEFDWFEHNKNKRLMEYDSGEKLAEFDDNGRGRWFYKNGRMALDYYDAEELNAQQRFVIYSSGEPDERGRAQPYTLLATFDYLGNGIVFDHGGKIRLKYNQTEGVVLDRSIGPVSHWKWHTLNDPPVLQQVMIDTQMAHKDPGILKLGGAHDDKTRPDNEDMLAIEFDNFIKEKSKKLSQSFKPFQIKMKALKINEHFSLKVLDQATVYLIFRDGTTNLKLNIGMVLDHKEIVDTDTAEVGEVSNNMERLPARTDSLAGLQKSIAHAQHYERSRTERELRLRPTVPSGSADRLVTAASRPMHPPFRPVPSGFTTTSTDCYCKCTRKPTSSNLYYDSRLC